MRSKNPRKCHPLPKGMLLGLSKSPPTTNLGRWGITVIQQEPFYMIRLVCNINEFRCYEAKIEVKKPAVAGSQTQDTPGLSHQCSATEPQQPDNHQPPQSSICIACTSDTECLSHTPGSHSVCAIGTPLGADRKILSIRKEPMLSGLLTLNAQSILPHAGNK